MCLVWTGLDWTGQMRRGYACVKCLTPTGSVCCMSACVYKPVEQDTDLVQFGPARKGLHKRVVDLKSAEQQVCVRGGGRETTTSFPSASDTSVSVLQSCS